MKRTGFIDARRIAGFTLSGALALNGQTLTISDVLTCTSGTSRGIFINYTQSGNKAGATTTVLGINLTLGGNVEYAFALNLYMVDSGNPALGFVAPISMYIDDLGTGLVGFCAIDLGVALTNAPSGRYTFMRLRRHAAARPTSAFLLEATPCSNLFDFQICDVPVVAAAVGGSQTHKIKCLIAGADYYIPLNTA